MEMMDQGDRVALAGASGMLGSALAGRLRSLHVSIVQLVRRDPTGADEVQWNPKLADPLPDVTSLEGLRAVVSFSGANLAAQRWTAAYRDEMTQSRVGSTAALARILVRLKTPPEVWISASAIGFYGDRGEEFLDEHAPAGKGFLADLCQQWEAATRPAEEAGIRVVHLRMGVVLGPREGALGKMLPLFRLGLGGRLGSGRQWMSWIGLEDSIEAIRFVIENPELRGAVNVTAPGPVTNAEFTRVLAAHLKRPALAPVPAIALKLGLGKMAEETLLASARVFPGKLTASGYSFRHPQLKDALPAVLR